MTIVAEAFEYVIGVDTHAENHHAAVIAAGNGALLGSREFASTGTGMAELLGWARAATGGAAAVLAAVECTGSYGARLARVLAEDGIRVAEVVPPARAVRRGGAGKTDAIDAEAAARGILAQRTDRLAEPKAAGAVQALGLLCSTRDRLRTMRGMEANALTALLRAHDLGHDGRRAPTAAQLSQIAAWAPRCGDDPVTGLMRSEAARMAERVRDLDAQLKANHALLGEHVRQLCPELLDQHGCAEVSAGRILAAFSHPGRFRSEAAFAAHAGAAPIPASSGRTQRHRLSRGGDRALNAALDTIARTRLRTDPESRAYAQRRRAEGLSHREIKRSLKRYIARQIYRLLNTAMATA